ncbi:MAG: tRNA pseudouridine(55) synthase TruB, partial [Rhodococcus sp. (in: high G+C Gram-positive bacteria)]|uniref:tRNA pseudouridine(55) synthase TruB n=1 Tax=Rhodococcus sp. TaxID=1831 RepID=UPI003BB7C5F5
MSVTENPALANAGLLVVDKDPGMTSHDVVARCRRLLGTRKVGHAGTLDPMATGVLVLGVERATKMLGLLSLTTKSYTATIRLGQSTVTDDAEGETVATADASGVSDDAIAAGVAALTGDIEQVPASVSAIKVDGKRAYARMREGETVELAARPVTVSRFTVVTRRDLPGDGFVDLD